jgi:glycosyltransferase involved in cell wall biosynthesis
MMILWHSNAPYACTGYGQQTALWLPRLQQLGHEVVSFAPSGHAGAVLNWQGIPVLPAWRDGFGSDILLDHYNKTGADLLFTLCDSYALNPQVIAKCNTMHWVPIDCAPMNSREQASLRHTGAMPVAMSQFGKAQLLAAGFSPRYIPHGIDCRIFAPPESPKAQRDVVGASDETFLIGLNAFNKDVMRKSYPEQFRAFAVFRERHPDSKLLVHAAVADPSAVDLNALARACGIEKHVFFPDQYAYACGMMTSENMASWYGALDLYTNCSYGEGFGIPIIEAQACGVPVVVSDVASMSELAGPGWKVPTEPFWVPAHQGWWGQPAMADIADAYEAAWQLREDGGMGALRQQCREFAVNYDADHVLTEYFEPVLKEAEASLP